MESLYSVKYKYTFDDYKKFYWFCFLSIKNIITFILIIIAGIFLTVYFHEPLFSLVLSSYLFIIFLIQNRQIKKIYKSNKVFQSESEIIYNFFDSYFTVDTEISSAKIEYSKLYKILESKQAIYLMIAKNQGYIFKKDIMQKELQDFIHDKKNNIK